MDWRLVYSQSDRVGIDVSLVPKARSGAAYAVYAAELVPVGAAPSRRWLIDSWAPLASLGAAAAPEPDSRPDAQAVAESPYEQGKLSAAWFLLPASLVLVLLLTLAGFGVRSVLRSRRAERHYRDFAGR